MRESANDDAPTPSRLVAVWDLPVRIVHWSLAMLVTMSWLTSEIGGNAMTYHMWIGYSILTLLVFRIAWGFAGSQHARFGSFLYGPVTVAKYLSSLLRLEPTCHVGHNPAGGWSVVALLLALSLQAVTGLFANDEIFTQGPLAGRVSYETSDLLTSVHRYNFYVLLGLICLHVAAVFFYLLVKRENLISAMFTGRKRVPAEVAFSQGRMASRWLAAATFLGAAGLVAAVVNWS